MRVLRYGFFGEDVGQRRFLAAYLPHCGGVAAGVTFEPVPYFGKQFGPMNNLVVDRRCADACREAFVLGHPRLNWLFVGRDVDSFEPARHQFLTGKLRNSIPERWQAHTLLLLPVQCIEHWLLYLAQYPDREPGERKPSHQVKETIYAGRAKSRAGILTELLHTLSPERIAWLAGVSPSFQLFDKQVGDYLNTLPPAQSEEQ